MFRKATPAYAAAACLSIFAMSAPSALALDPLPFPIPSPTPLIVVHPLPTAIPTRSPTPTLQPPPAPTVNLDESIPVLIDYGQGHETGAAIYRGVMDPVGFLPEQAATLTLTFPSTWAALPVTLGRLDGGVVSVPTSTSSGVTQSISDGGATPTFQVPVGGSFQFSFQAGRTRGLYRVVMSVGSTDYLLRFYVGTPAPGPPVPPLPIRTPNPAPPPQ